MKRWIAGITVMVSQVLALDGATAAKAALFPDPSQFGTPTPVPGISGMVSSVTLTPDGQTMVYCKFAGSWQLYSAQWIAQQNTWGPSQPLNPDFLGGYHMSPALSPDGNRLFYNDSGGGQSHLYVASNQGGTWGSGQQIILPLGLEGVCGEPFFDGTTLYFDEVLDWRDVPGQYVGTEIWKAPYDPIKNVLGTPVRLNSLVASRPFFNSAPRIVGDGNMMLFTHGVSGTLSPTFGRPRVMRSLASGEISRTPVG